MQNLKLQDLRQDAEIVHSKSFESAIAKLLSKQKEELNEDEKQDVTALLIKNGCPAPEFFDSDEKDFVVKSLKKRWMESTAELKKVEYTDARFILSTSDLLERFFSSAGFAYGEHRQSLLPVNLEMQLFMKCNQSLSNEETVSKIANKPRFTCEKLLLHFSYVSVCKLFHNFRTI